MAPLSYAISARRTARWLQCGARPYDITDPAQIQYRVWARRATATDCGMLQTVAPAWPTTRDESPCHGDEIEIASSLLALACADDGTYHRGGSGDGERRDGSRQAALPAVGGCTIQSLTWWPSCRFAHENAPPCAWELCSGRQHPVLADLVGWLRDLRPQGDRAAHSLFAPAYHSPLLLARCGRHCICPESVISYQPESPCSHLAVLLALIA